MEIELKEIKYLNSAGRLLYILQNINPQANQLTSQLVPIMFGIQAPAANNPEAISLIGVRAVNELHKLYADFLEDLESADMGDDERAVLKRGLSSLSHLMYPTGLTQKLRALSAAETSLLEVCATRLVRETPLNEDDLEKIKESLNALKASIDENTSSEVLTTILLELVRLSEDSISRYHIYGAKGLKKAFKSMLAEVAEVYLQNKEDSAELKKSGAWKTITNHLTVFDAVAAKTLKYKPLIEKASQLFLGGG